MNTTHASRLAELFSFIQAWREDRRAMEQKSYSSREKVVGTLEPLLWQGLTQTLAELEVVGSRLPEEEKTALAELYDGALRKDTNHLNSALRSALYDLQQTCAVQEPAFTDHFRAVLVDLRCWPGMGGNGKAPAELRPFGDYSKQINEATQNREHHALARLLDWEGSGVVSANLLQWQNSGTSLPSNIVAHQTTGWAWAVRNASRECLQVWLNAGADANAQDKYGRPVLAYAKSDEQVRVLLAAGADPLSRNLPWEARRFHLMELWACWASSLHWGLKSPNDDRHNWQAGLDYLRSSVRRWSEEDRLKITDGLAFFAFHGQWGKPNGEWWKGKEMQDFAAELANQPHVGPGTQVLLSGRSWSFAAGVARQWLLEKQEQHPSSPRLPLLEVDREVIEGVKESTIRSLVSLNSTPEKMLRFLVKQGPEAIERTFCFLLEEAASSPGFSLQSLVIKQAERVLSVSDALPVSWKEQALPAITEGLFKSYFGRWPYRYDRNQSTAELRNVVGPMRWVIENQDCFPVDTLGPLAFWTMAQYLYKDAPVPEERAQMRSILIGVARKGWDFRAQEWTSSQPMYHQRKALLRQDPALEREMDAGLTMDKLEQTLPAGASSVPGRARM